MCAIAGILDLYSDVNIIRDMQQTMKRRGPDEEGTFLSGPCALMHSRLTIIDPDGGRQPMQLTFAGEEYTIVYNGELYNTLELRQELSSLGHSFFSRSDTEVVLRSYAQWGDMALHKFNGIFAFAIWETKKRRLFLARDRMGVKPLFYKLHNSGLLFASEIKTILSYPSVNAELDVDGAAEIFLLGPGRTPGSGVFRGIHELEPGCFGCYRGGKWLWTRYWQLKDRLHEETAEETAEVVRHLVLDSIKRQMVSDFPVGTFLSGGLDSSLISAVCSGEMHSKGKKLPTFSLDFRNNDKYFVAEKFQPSSDSYYIEVMQRYLNSEQHWTVLTPDDLMNALADATYARDLPGMADVDFSLLAFCRNIKKHVKVALSGECADEIFGGYPWYRDPQIRDIAGFPWAQNTAYRAAFLSPWITDKIDTKAFVRDRYEQTIHESDVLPENTPIDRRMKEMVNLNHRWFMQTLLDRKDRMSMYCGLEVRVPFCDYRIAEYLYGVPWSIKDHGGKEKGLLRRAMSDLLPQEVLERKKSPYPKTYDPAYLQLMQDQLHRLIEDRGEPIHQLVRIEALENLIRSEYAWPWYGQLMRLPQTIGYMLQINLWMKEYNVQVV